MNKAEKTRNLRYRRPALAMIRRDSIVDELWEISEECESLEYAIADDEKLEEAFDGDSDEIHEFKMRFSDLTYRCDRLREALCENEVNEHFDDFFVGLLGRAYEVVGFDHFEEDYFNLTRFESQFANETCKKRLMSMTKEQFWRIIEDVNAVSQNHDQETVWTRIVENLSHYPLEDIMDWHLIYHEYKDAAYRDEMFAVSTALGSDYADEGLNNFRAWLISCGKEVFMNALREPVTLVDSPKKDGCFNYGKYDYAAFYAYNAKMFRIDPDSTQDLIYALEDYTLDRETIEDIHEELPKQQGFGQNGVGASFANYYSPNCGKNNAPQSDAIQALMDSGEVVHAYVYSNGGREEFLFHNTPENIASFIGSRPFVDQMILTTPMDELIMNTMGNFIDQCPDKELLEQVKETLIPIQLGEAEPQPIFSPSVEEVNEYYEQQENLDLGM